MVYLEVLGLTLLAVLLYDVIRKFYLSWYIMVMVLHYQTYSSLSYDQIWNKVCEKPMWKKDRKVVNLNRLMGMEDL